MIDRYVVTNHLAGRKEEAWHLQLNPQRTFMPGVLPLETLWAASPLILPYFPLKAKKEAITKEQRVLDT